MAEAEQPAATSKLPISKKWITVGIIVLIILIFVSMVWGAYNNFIRLDQGANVQWGKVQADFQRRANLIPNLVSTAQSYAQFEKSTLTQLTQLRSQWQTAANVNEQVKTANEMESALSKIIAVVEQYPTLGSIGAFRGLMDEITGSENRIATEMKRYNEFIGEYNIAIKVFPGNVFAGWFGFSERDYFSAKPGAENVPVVNITV
jgi:LemA protein